jgi:negative regulator of replication initiation
LNGKYIINKQVSAQDEQRPVKEGLQTKAPYICGTPMKILKQTPPNRNPFIIPFL